MSPYQPLVLSLPFHSNSLILFSYFWLIYSSNFWNMSMFDSKWKIYLSILSNCGWEIAGPEWKWVIEFWYQSISNQLKLMTGFKLFNMSRFSVNLKLKMYEIVYAGGWGGYIRNGMFSIRIHTIGKEMDFIAKKTCYKIHISSRSFFMFSI